MRHTNRSLLLAPLAALALFPLSTPLARADAFHTYGHSFRAIAMPPMGAGSTGLLGDALPDGRLVAVTGNSILLESAVGSGSFSAVATFDPAHSGGSADPAFVRVSPDGSRIAVGLGFNKPVAIVPIASLGSPGAPALLANGAASYFNVPHFGGTWADGSRLALTFGDFGSAAAVSLLDTLSTPAAPANPMVITNIGGASAGIAFDSAGRLYTGNGFDLGPGGSTTGTIRAFPRSVWDGTGAAANFELDGTLIGDVLSAGALLFDSEGNLIVGGGNFAADDVGYLGVINAAAVAAALNGSGPIDPSDPGALKRLLPAADPFAFYASAYNAVTGEVYATYTDFVSGANTWYATVPTPGVLGLVVLGSALAAGRRRRNG